MTYLAALICLIFGALALTFAVVSRRKNSATKALDRAFQLDQPSVTLEFAGRDRADPKHHKYGGTGPPALRTTALASRNVDAASLAAIRSSEGRVI